MKRVKITGRRCPRIVDTGPRQPAIDPDAFARAIGGERVAFEDLSPRSQAIVRTRGRR